MDWLGGRRRRKNNVANDPSFPLQSQTNLRLAVRHHHESLHGQAVGVQEQAVWEVRGFLFSPRLLYTPPHSSLPYFTPSNSVRRLGKETLIANSVRNRTHTERNRSPSSQKWKRPRITMPKRARQTKARTLVVLLRYCRHLTMMGGGKGME